MTDNVCAKCGNKENVVLHHVSYFPEKTIYVCRSCHRNIHIRVRKNNECPYTPEEVAKFSHASVGRRWYQKNREHKLELERKRMENPEYKAHKRKLDREYEKNYRKTIEFDLWVHKYCYVREQIRENRKTGTVSISSRFLKA